MVVLTPLTAKEMRSVTVPGSPHGGGDFFGSNRDSIPRLIIPCRKSGKTKARVPVRLCRS